MRERRSAAWVYPHERAVPTAPPGERTALYQVVRDNLETLYAERVAWRIGSSKERSGRAAPFLTMTWLTIVRQCC
ncbi:MAG TPA: hypothetical protein VK540_09870 [Polyangiaceae bacterium]|nr:hypothetical protein [Polyangiaceae bacterium]